MLFGFVCQKFRTSTAAQPSYIPPRLRTHATARLEAITTQLQARGLAYLIKSSSRQRAKRSQCLAFSPEELFGAGENVAVFGRFTYKSKTQGKTVESPFSILPRVHDGKIGYFQFMEDTFATAASFKSSGTSIFHTDPNGKEVEI